MIGLTQQQYLTQSYDLFVQQQAASYSQLLLNTAQSTLQANQSFAHAQTVKLHAIKNFNDLLASQKIGEQYKQEILDINYAKSVQNVWALRKSADINSRILDEKGLQATGQTQAQAVDRGIYSTTGSASTVQTQVIQEIGKMKGNNYREHLTTINKGIDQSLGYALEKAMSSWNFEQQQDFMKRSFVERL